MKDKVRFDIWLSQGLIGHIRGLSAPRFNLLWLLTNPEALHGSFFISGFPGSFKLPLYPTSSRNAITNVKALGNTEKENLSWGTCVSMLQETTSHSRLWILFSSPLWNISNSPTCQNQADTTSANLKSKLDFVRFTFLKVMVRSRKSQVGMKITCQFTLSSPLSIARVQRTQKFRISLWARVLQDRLLGISTPF